MFVVQSHTWSDSTTPHVQDAAPSPIQPVKSGLSDKSLKGSSLREEEEEAEDAPLAASDGTYVAKPRPGGGATGWGQGAGKDGSFVGVTAEEEGKGIETR